MRKVVMLSAAAILGIASIAVSQAEDVVDAPVAATEVVAADAPAEAAAADGAEVVAADTAAPAAEVASAAPAVEEEPIPQDTPQVQKLIALYPNLVARIKPVGSVCFEGGDICSVTARSSGPAAGDGPRDGATVYNAVCHTCHTAGLIGAPVFGDAGAWGPRIAKGADTLYTHAIQGFNAMPAKGGADIPDEEVQNAVDYMMAESS